MVYRPIANDTANRARRAAMAAWATYTPTWTSTGSAPTLGNGTLVGGYRREGTTLHLRGQLIVGSTTTVGTGDFRMSLPSGLTAAAAQYQVMPGFWYDPSATDVNRAIVIIDAGASYLTFQVADTVDSRLPTSSLAVGDIVTWTGTIEIAP